jgi:excisionase family DNA binding protein
VLSPAQAAAYLGVSRQTIYNLRARGALQFHKVGRSTRIRMSDLDALIGGPESGGTAA